MKILYIDPDTQSDSLDTRVSWLRKDDHEIDVASGLEVGSYSDYDLVIVFLGEPGSKFDMRHILADEKDSRMSHDANVLYAGINSKDALFAATQGATYCMAYQLAEPKSRSSILAKAIGTSISIA